MEEITWNGRPRGWLDQRGLERGKAQGPEKAIKGPECRGQKRELYQRRPSKKQMPNRIKLQESYWRKHLYMMAP